MRGLKDLESTYVPNDIPQAKESVKLVLPDNRTETHSDIFHSLPSCCLENGTGTAFSHTKRVLKVGHIQENGKRKCRRRALTKVLKVSSKVGVSSFCDGLTEIKVGFGSFGTDNANSSDVINNGSKTSGTSARKEDNSCNACQSLESSVGDYQSHYPKLQIGFCDDFFIESSLSNRYQTGPILFLSHTFFHINTHANFCFLCFNCCYLVLINQVVFQLTRTLTCSCHFCSPLFFSQTL